MADADLLASGVGTDAMGQRALDPARRCKAKRARRIIAPLPATPAMRKSPVTTGRPSETGKTEWMILPVEVS